MKDYLLGLQHIGIPTKDVEETIKFYESLGLTTYYRKKDDEHDVAFMRLDSFVIEAYRGDTVEKTGAIDHITFDVSDVDKVYAYVKAHGFKLIGDGITKLPFFDNGVRFFMIEGPNKELVEFNQTI